jgi:hypothetical protein
MRLLLINKRVELKILFFCLEIIVVEKQRNSISGFYYSRSMTTRTVLITGSTRYVFFTHKNQLKNYFSSAVLALVLLVHLLKLNIILSLMD